ncbi:MAG TPA: hypothetical protein PKY22_00615 [Accumulibacter sp.]|nr:hypothetical protein [Accumulibacter sp.]
MIGAADAGPAAPNVAMATAPAAAMEANTGFLVMIFSGLVGFFLVD